MPSAVQHLQTHSLVSDGSLCLEVEPILEPLIRRWLPRSRTTAAHPLAFMKQSPARIRVGIGRNGAEAPVFDAASSLLRLGSVTARRQGGSGDGIVLEGRGGVRGTLLLEARRATIKVTPEHDASSASWDLYSMLTVCSALLLSRSGRALVHAAAVVEPGGGAWLLVGDSHAGKTTTTVNLSTTGWGFLSDDQVIVSSGQDMSGLRVEGWLRPFHLDEGWESAAPGGRRVEVDPMELGLDRVRRGAALTGLLFPKVVPDLPTAASPVTAAEALCLLIRQTPWLFADRASAPVALELLQRAVALPAYRLRLGRDTYRDGARLLSVLAGLSPSLESAARA